MVTLKRPLSFNGFKERRTSMQPFDVSLFFVIVCLVTFGLIMVFSASIAMADNPRYEGVTHIHFFIRQIIFILVGLFFAGLTFTVSLETWQKNAKIIFVIALVLMVFVLIPGVGKRINGAYRWIPLIFFNLQPSELMKFSMIIYAADFAARKHTQLHLVKKVLLPFAGILFITGVLLMLEPDLGAAVVIMSIAVGILFVAGASLKPFAFLIALLSTALVGFIVSSPWRMERFMAYLNPWVPEYAQGKGYQLAQSLLAFGQGGIWGSGLGAGVGKLAYLPEAHTDFIMAVVGEELGLVGVIGVILAFVFIIRRAFDIGKQAVVVERPFSGLVAQGVGLWFGIQGFINLGVSMGVLPTKGLTLPLLSYGGSSIVISLCAVALLLRVDYENRVLMRGAIAYGKK